MNAPIHQTGLDTNMNPEPFPSITRSAENERRIERNRAAEQARLDRLNTPEEAERYLNKWRNPFTGETRQKFYARLIKNQQGKLL